MKKSKTISEIATPNEFDDKTKWVDWMPTFINFLRAIPGQNGVPLNYVCRKEPVVLLPTYTSFIDEYVDRTPITGDAFDTNNGEVYAYLVKFITKNDTA